MQHTGDCATVISLGIGDSAGAAVGIIGYGALIGADEVGIQYHVSCNGGIDIKGHKRFSVVLHPAAVPGAALGRFYTFQVFRVDFLAVQNCKCFGITAQSDVHMDLSCLLRRGPLGVNHTVTGGHGGQLRRGLGTGLAGGRGVPALEHIVGIHSVRSFGGVIVVTGQGCLILYTRRLGRCVYVVVLEVVAFARIIEIGSGVTIPVATWVLTKFTVIIASCNSVSVEALQDKEIVVIIGIVEVMP